MKPSYVFSTMRAMARAEGKAIPSVEELETMVPALMMCPMPHCSRTMRWRTPKGESRASSISLQHWPDGRMSLICFSCNKRLGAHRMELPPLGYKECALCKEVKPTTEYHRSTTRLFDLLQGTCKSCNKERRQS